MNTTDNRSDSSDGATRITVTVPESSETEELLRCLLGHSELVDEGQIHLSIGDSRSVQTVVVAELTHKQRQAVLTADELGYYDTPRSGTLGDVAAELEISDSAASSRLKTVERKLVSALAEELRE
ncbi:bacterio-opsin activator HTH domain-containing protein [Halalkaliarchaeum desulfuricum]|uniref:Bacterio-opsin activator HTH domain-containing protein n=1 Tax=Halalkaliarchaeum desulfuricum TaxID=2055893 RepID=A0A343TMU0_9EURY|nr:helix-turn-helix domain-containing protein [Halalkaliarchaeum desulfuricum]AUX10412.1 bacterio-opsin activator HTH domain-containing protein [Halalkaliarchaeum desulfuricum]